MAAPLRRVFRNCRDIVTDSPYRNDAFVTGRGMNSNEFHTLLAHTQRHSAWHNQAKQMRCEASEKVSTFSMSIQA